MLTTILESVADIQTWPVFLKAPEEPKKLFYVQAIYQQRFTFHLF